METLRNYVAGEWVASESGCVREVTNPATNEVLAQVPMSTPQEAARAVEVAYEAFWEWRSTPPITRASYMFRLKALIEEHF